MRYRLIPELRNWETAVKSWAGANGFARRMLFGTLGLQKMPNAADAAVPTRQDLDPSPALSIVENGPEDTLLRPASPSATAAQGNTDGSREEMIRLFTSSFRNGGDMKANDREYVAKVVAARTGVSQAEADKRVNDVITQTKADLDAVRKATAQLAFWLVASLLVGAFCASLAATECGQLRNGIVKSRGLSPAMRT